MWSFFKAVTLGALAAAALPTMFIVGLALMTLSRGVRGDGDIWQTTYLIILPLIVAFPVVLTASVLVGLPLAALLKKRGEERQEVYLAAGIFAGALIPIAVLLALKAPSGYWMTILGALGGGVTAQVWWSSRRAPQDG